MEKINYCLHSHTYRCGHAEGKDEDYILNAIKFGLTYYGVSDHVILPNIVQPGMRGAWYEREDYLNSIDALKKKYQNQITIFKGFECEYMPEYVSYYQKLLDTKQVDYLILGQHMYFDHNKVVWYMDLDPETAVKKYTEHLIEGIKSKLFTYVAHPDLFMCFTSKWGKTEIECAKKIIAAAVKYDIPLEVNLCHARIYGKRDFAGVYGYYQYPFNPFWEMVAKSKARVVVGFDSHRPIDVYKPGLEILDFVVSATKIKPILKLELNKNNIKKI